MEVAVTPFTIPPAGEVRDRLAAAMAEVRMLRRLLQLAKDAEKAQGHRQAANARGATT
jgi:hypothetical protein